MSDIAIKIENLSKQYRLGNVGTGTLPHDLKSWWAKTRGKEDPNLQIGMENKLSEKGGDYVYALKDINLEVKQGDILGVIGKNGAGKSTLLKILSRVTTPTSGTIDMYGRVASLLEVGTGFHPELTGRENIFLNGAIMGMTKEEIKLRFDEIIDFAGVGKYVDTPVKRYSSGMYVRLGFAVAAHLEPEILIVDEVLAVGDADFQKKAIGKMQDVSKNQGRTVLFVSHNIPSVLTLCTSGVLLVNGNISYYGQIESVVDQYISKTNNSLNFYHCIHKDSDAYVSALYLTDKQKNKLQNFSIEDDIVINVELMYRKYIEEFVFSVIIFDKRQQPVFSSHLNLTKSTKKINGTIPKRFLMPGFYQIKFFIHIPNVRFIDQCDDKTVQFELVDTGTEHSIYRGTDLGLVMTDLKWNILSN